MPTNGAGVVIDPKNPPPYPKPVSNPTGERVKTSSKIRRKSSVICKAVLQKKGDSFTLKNSATTIKVINDVEILIKENCGDMPLQTGQKIQFGLDTLMVQNRKLIIITDAS